MKRSSKARFDNKVDRTTETQSINSNLIDNNRPPGNCSIASGWCRVSPAATIYFALKEVKKAVAFWPALVGLWAGGDFIQSLFWQYGIYLIILFGVAAVFLDYWFFKFKQEEDRILIQRGVFKRINLTLFYDRVQQADTIEPFYFRLFRLATLGLESAGSADQEVDIPGLPIAVANQLKINILKFKNSIQQSEQPSVEDIHQEEECFQLRLSVPELARYGLMHNGLLFLLPLMAPYSQVWSEYFVSIFPYLENSGLYLYWQTIEQHESGFTLVLLFFIASLIGLVVLSLASSIFGIVKFWDYQLIRKGDQYQYRAGLLTVKTAGFRLHKLQKVTVVQGVFARALNRFSLTISKAGRAGIKRSGEGAQFQIPVLTGPLLIDVSKQLDLAVPLWSKVSSTRILTDGIKGLILSFCVGVLSAAVLQKLDLQIDMQPSVIGAVFYFTYILVSWRAWWCFEYFCDDKWLIIKRGFIGKKIIYIPVAKIQKIQETKTPWLNWLKVRSLAIWSGDGKETIPYLNKNTSDEIKKHLLYTVCHSKGAWL